LSFQTVDELFKKCTGKKEITDRDRFTLSCTDEKVRNCLWEELRIKYNQQQDQTKKTEDEDKLDALKVRRIL
jgi:hypothetical protein